MNTKLHNIMAYFCSKTTHKSDLSKARLTKLVYLADWKMSQLYGRQVTNIQWLFNHYGPYVDDITNLARDSADFRILQTRNQYGSLKEQFEYIGYGHDFPALISEEMAVLDMVIKETEPMYFNDFITHVYATYPVAQSDRYATLELSRLAAKESMANK